MAAAAAMASALRAKLRIQRIRASRTLRSCRTCPVGCTLRPQTPPTQAAPRPVAVALRLLAARLVRAWRGRHDRRRAETALIGDGIGDVEQGAEPPPGALTGVEDADLGGVWVDADGPPVHLADHQQADWIAVVAVPVRPALTTGEADDLSLRQLLPAAGAIFRGVEVGDDDPSAVPRFEGM